MKFAVEIDGQKIALESDINSWGLQREIQYLLPKIKWGEEGLVAVKIYKVEINKNFVPKFTFVKTIEVEPLNLPITGEDYSREMEKMLSKIPQEFHSYVSTTAYDRGHSSGYEECLQIAQEIVSDLKGPIEKYKYSLSQGMGG